MRVLLLNISGSFSTRLAITMQQLGHAVDVVQDQADAQPAVLSSTHDLVMIDLDGATPETVDLVRWIRVTKPVLKILVCKNSDNLDLVGLAMSKGAHDFVVKPLNIDELKMRLLALETQGQTPNKENIVVNYGPLRVDMASRQVSLYPN